MKNLKEIFTTFVRLGFTAFGGPAAHIAMMQDEVVDRKKWMSREHFLDMVGATNLIPGPNSTEMTMHCGFHHGDFAGLVVAGLSFIIPSAILTGILGWIYKEYGTLPDLQPFVYGIRPAVIAVIAGAVYKLGKKAVKGWQLALIGLAVTAASLLGGHELLAILLGGFFGMLFLLGSRKISSISTMPLFVLTHSLLSTMDLEASAESAAKMPPTVSTIFLSFLKIGAILFGSGYVLVAYLEAELIHNLKWLTRQELLDAVAIGQFTPGPVLTTATFIGYYLHGIPGALAATLGIFLPSFLFVALLNPLIPKMRKSRIASAFLDAVNVSAVGIMAGVILKIGYSFFFDWRSALIGICSCALVFGTKKFHSAFVILFGAVAGYILLILPF